MKKLIKLEFNNTTRERKTEDSYSELYSHDKNNGSFEFEILNDTLTTEQVIALFKFTESNKIWKTTGTVEGNKVKVTFDTTLITQNETVICYLYFDEEQRTSDTFRFKFKVKVSEIDKMNRYEVKERFINNTVIVDRLDVVTKTELQEALKNVGGIATEGLLTEVKAEELYAKKSEAVDNTNFELVKNRVLALELKTDKDTVYDDSELKGRISVLEAREDNNTIYDDTNVRERLTALESKPNVDVNNLVTKDELASKNYLTEHQDTSNFALKSEIPQQYNDTEVKERLTTLENKPPVDLSGYVTKEELKNVSGSQPLADNLVTKEELENKHYISDVSNLATKEELQEVRNSQPTVDTSHLVTKDELESKGYVKDLSEYAKKSELYNDSDLKARVEVLEQKTDKDTVYDDTPLKERVTALESKAIEGGAYDDSDLRNRVVALETKEDKDTKYDDTEVKHRLTELENKPAVDTSFFVTEEKLNEKGYLTQHQDLTPYALKSEIPQPYNDTPLTERVTALENKPTTGGSVDTSNLVTKTELKEKEDAIYDIMHQNPLYKVYEEDTLTEHLNSENVFGNGNIDIRGGTIYSNGSLTTAVIFKGDAAKEKSVDFNTAMFTVANSIPDNYSISDLTYGGGEDKKVTFLSNKNFSEVVPKEELKAIVKEVSTGSNIDTSNLATKEELSKAVTKEELEAKHYVTEEELNNKGYLTTHQRLDNVVTKEELATKGYITDVSNLVTKDELESKNYLTIPYNDTPLKERVEVLENKVDKDTVYNDSELRERVTNLENKPNVDLSNYVTNEQLENKHYLTQHQELTHLATTSDLEALRNIAVSKSELNNKVDTTEFNTFKDNVVTKSELAEKGYISDLSNYVTKQELHEATEIDYSNIVTTDELEPYAKKSELPTPYNDSALVSRVNALESKQDKDTVYNDTEVKQRLTALENRPSTGGGAQTQDTGWITISENNPLNGNVVKIRRINDVVHVSLSNPDNESTHLQLEVTDGHGAVLANKEIQKGFTPMRTIIVPVISNIETIMLSTDLSTTGQAVFEVENNRVTLKVYDKDITSGIPTNKYINDFSYFTEDPFPTNLH